MNAYSASEGKRNQYAQTCWDETSPDGTMHVLEGEYTAENRAFWQLKIGPVADGSQAPEKQFKTLLGEGRVILRGARSIPYTPSRKTEGGTWVSIARGASRLRIQNFHVSRVASGIRAAEGGNTHLQFQDLHFEDTRQNFIISGHPDCISRKECPVKPDQLTREILIQNTSGRRYSKRHVRLGQGISKVSVVDSHADAEFLDGDFAVGFDVENPARNIEFIRCSSRANIYSLSAYWNGDGFKAENETDDIRWINCSAFDNADGGFDIKTDNARLENIVALRNSRNIRIWSPKRSVIKNALSSYAKHHGGENTPAGLWSAGAVDCRFCTLHNNSVQIQAENNQTGSWIRLNDSILSSDLQNSGDWIIQEKGTRVKLVRTAQWKAGVSGTDPKYGPGADARWEGGQEFNSRLYGRKKGYYDE